MEISVDGVLKARKFPFIFSFFILLLFIVVSFLFLSDSESQIPVRYDLATPQPSIIIKPSTSATSPLPEAPIDSSIPSVAVTGVSGNATTQVADLKWSKCIGPVAVDYIPCLDNFKAMKKLKGQRRMERKERHCPQPNPRCLIPLPTGYKIPVSWPKSRDRVWFNNVPHPKLVEFKKDQNWVQKDGDYLVFPGGGTQFKDGVMHYVNYIEKTLPAIEWGKLRRVVLDVGCGVASFGGYMLDRGVMTMSFAPKDEHEAQIQFALERGIPATLAIIATQRLPFPDNAFDLIHCSRCRVHWHGNGGKPLLELNRVLRPGGYFIWSATPVYQDDDTHKNVWEAMVALTESICWKVVAKAFYETGIGLAIYQKPVTSYCYQRRKENKPPMCDQNRWNNISWYAPLDNCIPPLPEPRQGDTYKWPVAWPERLNSKPVSLSTEADAEMYYDDTKHWSQLVSGVYRREFPINWSSVRNVMDMNAGYGGFAAALIDLPLWVMNVIPVYELDTLPVIFDRGLIGIYHDWCESLSTYPRSYDLLHATSLFGNLKLRCDITDVVIEMDRILRPGGFLLVKDTLEMTNKLAPILRSLHWSITLHSEQFLVATKGFWRPQR